MSVITSTSPHAAQSADQPQPSRSPNLDQPRALATRTIDDVMSVFGSIVGSLGLVWIVIGRLLPLSGVLGFLICWYLAFVAMYTLVTSMSHPRTVVLDRFMRSLICGAALVVGFALVSTIVFVFYRGHAALFHVNFYTHDMFGVQPNAPLAQGGISMAIVGSFIELGIAVVISLPLGIGAAIYMTEVGGRVSRTVRTVVEAMTALPDLLAGLFIYTFLIIGFHFFGHWIHLQKSGLAAGLALAVTMLPIIARSAELSLRVVPGGLREAGLALGSSRWRVVSNVVLPTAAPGLATALILAVARGIGETAPVLIVSGASSIFNINPVKNPMNSLPLFIFTSVKTDQPNAITRAFGAACVLLFVVLVLFAVLRFIASRQQKGASR
jgi:phosphate transport system permease protein